MAQILKFLEVRVYALHAILDISCTRYALYVILFVCVCVCVSRLNADSFEIRIYFEIITNNSIFQRIYFKGQLAKHFTVQIAMRLGRHFASHHCTADVGASSAVRPTILA